MMKKVKFFGKFILFLLLFAGLFICLQEVLRDKWLEGEYNTSSKVKGFYAEEKDTLDVVFVGSSQMYADMVPAVLYENYGIASYDFCANEQPLWVSYYYIKEAIANQHPETIVLDVFTVYGEDYEAEGAMHINLDDLPLNKNKIDAIKAGVPAELRYSYYFPLAKYHNTWTGLYEGKATTAFYSEKDPNKGYSPFVFAAEYEESAKAEVANQEAVTSIPDRAREWLLKIIDLCDAEGVDLVLIKTPNGNAERQMLYNDVTNIAAEKNVPFLNMNVLLDGQAHVNVLQAEKITQMMGDYLVSLKSYPDHRGDEKYASFEESVQLFHRQKKKTQIISATTFADYVPLLTDEQLVVVIAAKNTSNSAFSTSDIEVLNTTLGANCELAVNPSKPYVLVLDGGQIVYETPNAGALSQDEGAMDVPGLTYDQVDLAAGGVGLSIHSDGSMVDGNTNILLNGTDFSMNMDGFNVVIYDKYLGEAFEMAYFDVTDEMRLVRK